MAGNIIHAIATTNAIISGLIVVEAVKMVAGHKERCRDSALYPEDDGKRYASYIQYCTRL
jgi:ubiquitin-like 1-activating enzyme E1 B